MMFRRREGRASYEEIPDHDVDEFLEVESDDDESQHDASSVVKRYCPCLDTTAFRPNRHSSLVVLSSFMVFIILFSGTVKEWRPHLPAHLPFFHSGLIRESDIHKSTLPTLFSLVDPDTQEYLYALDNELYNRLETINFEVENGALSSRRGHLFRRPKSIRSAPELRVDKQIVAYRDSFTLSWTTGEDDRGRPVITEDSVVLFVCTTANATAIGVDLKRDILEAATIRQVRATSTRHGGDSGDRNSWFTPRFPVVRRDVCKFMLFRPLSRAHMQLVAESDVIRPLSSNRPTAIHLAWRKDPSELTVNFVTGAAGIPVVNILDPSDGTVVATFDGTSDTYSAGDMCQAPANETAPGKYQPPGWLHSVVITGLQPDTVYEYKVGLKGGQGVVFSDQFQFQSAPLVGPNHRSFSYVVYGDQGCPSTGWGEGEAWTAALTAREIEKKKTPIRSVHHFGDLSYAQGAAHVWDEWFAMIQVFTTRVPLMIGVGNHEYDHTDGGVGKDPSGVETAGGFSPKWGNFRDDSGGECGVPTARRFSMPHSSNTSNGVFWYSHDFASVHTTVISSEHDLSPGSPQHAWLEQDLASVDRSRTPWLIVETHRPLYEGETVWEQNSVGIGMRFEMEDLLRDHDVDLVLAGHYHAYHRTCDGLYRSKCAAGGPMHITVGSAGAHLDDAWLYQNEWSEKYIRHEYGYGRITVENSTALRFQFVKTGGGNKTRDGEVLDEVWLRRRRV